MRLLVFLILSIISTSAFGDDYRHMISLGSNGLGWSYSYEDMNTNNGSVFKEVKNFINDFSINYAYRISRRWQFGGFYQSSHNEYRFYKNGDNSYVETEINVLGIFGIYNFSNEISDAWYVGASASNFKREEENSHNWTETERKAPFELDDAGYTLEVITGKRFSLKRWNIDHITYAPQISIFHRKHGRDFNDQKIAPGTGFTFQIIKFDFLF